MRALLLVLSLLVVGGCANPTKPFGVWALPSGQQVTLYSKSGGVTSVRYLCYPIPEPPASQETGLPDMACEPLN